MKKKWIIGLCITVLLLSACSNSINMENVVNEPNFNGVIEQVYESSILVRVNEDEEECKSSDLINVSLDVELKDSIASFEIADEVTVYYDGMIAETYPAQINKVYAIIKIDS